MQFIQFYEPSSNSNIISDSYVYNNITHVHHTLPIDVCANIRIKNSTDSYTEIIPFNDINKSANITAQRILDRFSFICGSITKQVQESVVDLQHQFRVGEETELINQFISNHLKKVMPNKIVVVGLLQGGLSWSKLVYDSINDIRDCASHYNNVDKTFKSLLNDETLEDSSSLSQDCYVAIESYTQSPELTHSLTNPIDCLESVQYLTIDSFNSYKGKERHKLKGSIPPHIYKEILNPQSIVVFADDILDSGNTLSFIQNKVNDVVNSHKKKKRVFNSLECIMGSLSGNEAYFKSRSVIDQIVSKVKEQLLSKHIIVSPMIIRKNSLSIKNGFGLTQSVYYTSDVPIANDVRTFGHNLPSADVIKNPYPFKEGEYVRRDSLCQSVVSHDHYKLVYVSTCNRENDSVMDVVAGFAIDTPAFLTGFGLDSNGYYRSFKNVYV